MRALLLLSLLVVSAAACSKTAVKTDPAAQTAQPPARTVDAAQAAAEEEERRFADAAAANGAKDASALPPPVVYFDYDTAQLSEVARTSLDEFAHGYAKGGDKPALVVEGHCDERGTEEYNLVLGEKRATAVRQYLSRTGVPEKKLKSVSYGASRPASHGHDESAWSQNRRSEVKPVASGR